MTHSDIERLILTASEKYSSVHGTVIREEDYSVFRSDTFRRYYGVNYIRLIGGMSFKAAITLFRKYFDHTLWPHIAFSVETDYARSSFLSDCESAGFSVENTVALGLPNGSCKAGIKRDAKLRVMFPAETAEVEELYSSVNCADTPAISQSEAAMLFGWKREYIDSLGGGYAAIYESAQTRIPKCALSYYPADDSIVITDLLTRPEWRRKGFAQALIRYFYRGSIPRQRPPFYTC